MKSPDMFKNYAQPEDLLSDDTFLSWYFKTDPDDIQKWEKWIAENPGEQVLVQQAIELLKGVQLTEKELTGSQVTAAEHRLFQKIQELESRQAPVRSIYRNRWWAVAAAVLLIVSGTMLTRSLLNKPELKTAYGEIKKQNLPDGTEVMLNAHSKLSYAVATKDGKDREVWVNGEAFFHVSKTPMKSRFIVHTDRFDIIVTGTQFNVVNRNGLSNVMLKEGGVIIRTDDGKEMKMVPGDFVEFNNDHPAKKLVKNDSVLAWKDHKLVFDNTPLSEVVTIIKEHYGIDVKLANGAIAGKTVSGILPNDNLDVFLETLEALEATMNLEIIRNGDSILIKDRP
jgi:ferric-dicitrate binding protein FerR (iron transport regulator)